MKDIEYFLQEEAEKKSYATWGQYFDDLPQQYKLVAITRAMNSYSAQFKTYPEQINWVKITPETMPQVRVSHYI